MNHLRNALWMQERGHDVSIFCWANSPLEKNALELQVPVVRIAKHRKYFDYAKAFKMSKLIKDLGITHLLLRATYDISIGSTVKTLLGNKIHVSYFMEMQLGVKKTNLLHTLRFRKIDVWSCPLNWLAEQVKTMTRFPHDRVVVIPSGIKLSDFNQDLSQTKARKLLALPENITIIGLIGRFDRHKGQLLLIEAMMHCKSSNFHLAFLGEPTRNEGDDYYNKMLALISENKLEDRVHIRPFRKDIVTFYKAIDWFVMASKAETFGMVTIEAMASGTPTIGSKAGGTPEILENGKIGVLFNPLDAHDLGLKLDEILSSERKISPQVLIEKAKKYDHNLVCESVEKVLGLSELATSH